MPAIPTIPVRIDVHGFFSWPAQDGPPAKLVYEGLDFTGRFLNPDASLPGFCAYYGHAPRIQAIGADFRWATENDRGGTEIKIQIVLHATREAESSWEYWRDADGELVDLRARRISRPLSRRLKEFFGAKPAPILAEHPQRVAEAAQLFPRAKAILWTLELTDGPPRPVMWIRTPTVIQEIQTFDETVVTVPGKDWEGWR